MKNPIKHQNHLDKNVKENGRINGIGDATIWQRLTFGWVTNLVWNYGRFEGKITPEILPELMQSDDSGEISKKFEIVWNELLAKGKPSLWVTFYRVLGREFILIGILGLMESIFKILVAVFLGFFIKFLRNPEKPVKEGLIYAAALSCFALLQSIFQHHFYFPCTRVGYKVRVGLIALLFRKAITISSSSMVSTGEAINIISNDVQPFETGISFLHFLWLGPIELILSIGFLWLNIGISGLVAVGVYLLMVPFQSYVSRLFRKIRSNTVKFRDNRIKLLTDVLSGIEIVKLNSWEFPLLKRIINLRKLEYKSLKRSNTLKAINQALFSVSSQIVQLCTFSTLWMLVVLQLGHNFGGKGSFQPENIFPCVTLFSTMGLTITLFVPKAFEYYGEMKVSVERIEKFLLLPSTKPIGLPENENPFDPTPNDSNPNINSENTALILENASFSWKNQSTLQKLQTKTENTLYSFPKTNKPVINPKEQSSISISNQSQNSGSLGNLSTSYNGSENQDTTVSENRKVILKDLNFTISRGELCGIVGPVGSGKSSLCCAILGEMHLVSGKIHRNFKRKSENLHFFGKNNNKETNTPENNNKHHSIVAYSSQSPWIFGGTIRDNIIFGLPYDEEWFKTVVSACSLDRDFEMLENKCLTLVGERGTTLSGGQKARVSLARAVYTKAEFYVLDDPLSAVDPKVGKHLFDNVICGLLKGKTRVLVTHQLQFIHSCNQILLLEFGKIRQKGVPKDIKKLDEYQFDEIKNLLEYSATEKHKTAEPGSEFDSDSDYDTPVLDNKLSVPSYIQPFIDSSSNPSISYNKKSDNKSHDLMKSRKRSYFSKFLLKKSRNDKKLSIKTINDYKLGDEEKSSKSKTPLTTYVKFFQFGASNLRILLIFVLAFCKQGINMFADYYLSKWSTMPPEQKANPRNVYIYLGLIMGSFTLSLITCVLLYRLILSASNGLLIKMLNAIIRAPLSFFQSQPLGRVLNRFSKDQSNTDESLTSTTVDTLMTSIQTLGILVLVCISNKYILVTVPFILGVFIWLRQLYMKTSRQVKKIESVSRSPVYSILSETLDGLITIRAFALENKFLGQFIDAQNANSRAFFAFIGAARWLAFRLDIVNSILITSTSFSLIAIRGSISPSLVALSMSYILTLVGLVQWCIRQSIEVEITFISVERNIEYSNLKPEESPKIEQSVDLVPTSWPDSGKVEIYNLNLKYPFCQEPVLKNISISINPGEKIGIVGRTGAGKSSLVSSLFRLVEPYPNGCIHIDGINISTIQLKRLRSSISMIPQQPFLFEGCLRFNLDPLDEYTDEMIWIALEATSLKAKVEDMPEKLDSLVVENGKNFSVGERQLISLCRAILHNKKVVVMDEATANVDLETDKQIQQSIHTHFKNSTVITIAHRLDTVIGAGYDKIAVLDHGKLMEFGTPHKLLSNPDSLLSKMVAETGSKTKEKLKFLAHRQFNSGNKS
ncbi:hypothetical protein BB559_001183 [Furculomyces boomerangus]|uniref:Uncharacterized protein n=1 Tax=Furculomyces boomerangus TaxID=61424 RepID=A0A2T9Z2R5_9FUNG|nr:hypothetical protein BB559_001183 [Furculomyces boomerangus]